MGFRLFKSKSPEPKPHLTLRDQDDDLLEFYFSLGHIEFGFWGYYKILDWPNNKIFILSDVDIEGSGKGTLGSKIYHIKTQIGRLIAEMYSANTVIIRPNKRTSGKKIGKIPPPFAIYPPGFRYEENERISLA